MRGAYQLNNASGVLMALELLAARFPVSQAQVRGGLLNAVLPGRFQTLPGQPLRVFDVAHNVEAVEALAANLRRQPRSGRTVAVCGMRRDKPMVGALQVMASRVDAWHMATLDTGRGATAQELAQAAADAGINVPVSLHADVGAAYLAACAGAGPDDRVVVFGLYWWHWR